MQNKSLMAAEFREAPDIVRRQAQELTQPIAQLVALLKHRAPQVVVTCARGSSAHAATFGKHLIERHLGIPVSAVAPNIATVYQQHSSRVGRITGQPDSMPAIHRMLLTARRQEYRANVGSRSEGVRLMSR